MKAFFEARLDMIPKELASYREDYHLNRWLHGRSKIVRGFLASESEPVSGLRKRVLIDENARDYFILDDLGFFDPDNCVFLFDVKPKFQRR